MKKLTQYTLLLSIFSLLALTQSCEDDFDLYAEYEDITVVYGLLDPNVARHQIKVTHIFQGEEDVNILAQDPENSEYGPEEITVEVIEIRPNLIDTARRWTLDRVQITDKDTGTFYAPNQIVYEFIADLKSDHNYMFKATKSDGTKVTSITSLVDRGNSPVFDPNQNFQWSSLGGMPLMQSDVEPNEKLDIKLLSVINTSVYDLYFEFSWRDEYPDGSMSDIRSINFSIGLDRLSQVPEDPADRETFFIRMIPTDFYTEIAEQVLDITDEEENIVRRVPEDLPVALRLMMGGQDLDTYMLVSEPSNSINEEKPSYTNIENGLGVFSTRTLEVTRLFLSKKSMDELVNGESLGLTGAKGFCNHDANSADPTACR